MVQINGKNEDIAGKNLRDYLHAANYDTRIIVVEINEKIIEKEQYQNTIIKDGDIIEIITFMGGGTMI